MYKIISFRDFIDLEPKPKRVKHQGDVYEYNSLMEVYDFILDDNEYLNIPMRDAKEPNIEIIEEDKPLIEKLPPYKDISLDGYTACAWDLGEQQLKNKLDEVIDYINSKGDK